MAAHCVISYLHIPCSTNLTYGLPTDLYTGEGVPTSHSDIYFIPRAWPTSLTVVNCKLAPQGHILWYITSCCGWFLHIPWQIKNLIVRPSSWHCYMIRPSGSMTKQPSRIVPTYSAVPYDLQEEKSHLLPFHLSPWIETRIASVKDHQSVR